MNLRDALRTAILCTNPYRPFSHVNRYPYYVAIKAFTGMCSRHPTIKSVYLRSGLVERAWVPGLSDIDFIVIIGGNLSEVDEFGLLQRFWRQFAWLKSFFPMIGEVDILTDRHIRSWVRFGFTGQMAHNWRLLLGSETIPESGADPQRFSRDCLNYSLHWMEWYSRSYFARRFFTRDEHSGLLARDLARLASKFFRSLQHITPETAINSFPGDSCDDEHELCARIITAMEAAIRRLARPDDAAQLLTGEPKWLDHFVSQRHPPLRQADAFDGSAFARWSNLLECALLDFNDQLYVVFRDGLDAAALASCLAALRESIPGKEKRVAAVSRTTFTYMIRHYLPLDYVHLLRHRTVVFGTDLVLEITAPPGSSFVNFLLGQVPNLLGFAQSRALHAEPKSNPASLLERGLLLRLLLEHGTMAPLPQIALREAERCFPKEMRLLHGLANGGISLDRAELFATFKMLAEKIHADLESARANETMQSIGEGGQPLAPTSAR